MTLLSNEENKEISLSSELSQASTEKVGDITERLACDNSPSFFALARVAPLGPRAKKGGCFRSYIARGC